MSIPKGYLLVACCALFTAQALAGAKAVKGLEFQVSPPQTQKNCFLQPFYVWHEGDAFFKNLKQVKTKPTTEYRRGSDIVANYPDSTTVIVGVRAPDVLSCVVLPTFDPAKVRFRVEWQTGSQVTPANGTFVVSRHSPARPWCESKCADDWEYELRIDSQDVPLKNQLLLTIEAQDGTRLAKYLGRLSTAKPDPHPFNLQ